MERPGLLTLFLDVEEGELRLSQYRQVGERIFPVLPGDHTLVPLSEVAFPSPHPDPSSLPLTPLQSEMVDSAYWRRSPEDVDGLLTRVILATAELPVRLLPAPRLLLNNSALASAAQQIGVHPLFPVPPSEDPWHHGRGAGRTAGPKRALGAQGQLSAPTGDHELDSIRPGTASKTASLDKRS